MKKQTFYSLLWVLLALTTFACSSKKAEDAFASFQRGANGEIVLEGEIKTDLTLTATNKYILRGFVYVTSGATLTIEPGTIIKGEKATKGTLIIEQGAKIQAIGTSTSPIVFTSDQAKGARNYGDWGGLVIIGKAPHNRPSATAFEGGIRGSFGTFNDANDNSGTLKYVRVEFCGIALTTASNSEINGLTLYAVGKGTTIEYVQVSYSGDDSFEWFGGNADAKYLIAYRGWDDDFDTDFGFTGNVQFGLVLRNPAIADQSGSNAFESDNFGGSGTPATAANDGLPLTAPKFSNISVFTTTGTPTTATQQGNGGFQSAMHLRRNTAIAIYNSVFVGYPEGLRLDGTATYANFNGTATTTGASNATLQGITFSNMSADYKEAGGTLFADIKTYFETATRKNNPAASTTVASLLLNANAFTLGSAADFRPQSTSPLVTNANTATVPTGLTQTTYRGAFDATTNWTSGWANFDPQNADY